MQDTLMLIGKDLQKNLEFIHSWMIKNKKTLAVAESCTGGRIASLLTAIPGASKYFQGSAVVYSAELKQKLLGVSSKTLRAFGVVSKQTVEEMAMGILKVAQADIALAITGVAGPTTEGNIPIGTIWMSLLAKGKDPITWKSDFQGSREQVLKLAAMELLSRLESYLHLK